MKRSILAVMVSVCLILASTAFAAGQSGRSDQRATGAQASAAKIIKADDLAGKKVQDNAGNDIGEIKSVALDTTSGNAYAMIELDDKLHPVPVTALKKMGDDYSLSIDKNRLAQSPSLTEDMMEQTLSQTNFSNQVHRFFGVAPPTGPETQQQRQRY